MKLVRRSLGDFKKMICTAIVVAYTKFTTKKLGRKTEFHDSKKYSLLPTVEIINGILLVGSVVSHLAGVRKNYFHYKSNSSKRLVMVVGRTRETDTFSIARAVSA